MVNEKFFISKSSVPQSIIEEAKNESMAIYESEYAGKNSLSGRSRSYDDILKDTLLGKIGEYFIKSKFGYINDDAKWHDLISPKGVRTEVKTRRKQYITDKKIQEDIQRLKNMKKDKPKWFFSSEVIIISYDEEMNVLEVQGVYNIE